MGKCDRNNGERGPTGQMLVARHPADLCANGASGHADLRPWPQQFDICDDSFELDVSEVNFCPDVKPCLPVCGAYVETVKFSEGSCWPEKAVSDAELSVEQMRARGHLLSGFPEWDDSCDAFMAVLKRIPSSYGLNECERIWLSLMVSTGFWWCRSCQALRKQTSTRVS